MDHHNHREYSRITIHHDVTLVVQGEAGSEPCILENVSMGGVKFYAKHKLEAGTHVELRVPSPTDDPEIVIQATILRAEPGDSDNPYAYACMIESTQNT